MPAASSKAAKSARWACWACWAHLHLHPPLGPPTKPPLGTPCDPAPCYLTSTSTPSGLTSST